MKFALIDAEKAEFPIRFMCEQLEVSRSGYYAWQGRPPSARAVDTTELGEKIEEVYKENKGRYGSPRIVLDLAAHGRCTSRKRVARIMRDKGLVARCRKRLRRTTDSNHPYPIAENLLDRDFNTDAAGRARG